MRLLRSKLHREGNLVDVYKVKIEYTSRFKTKIAYIFVNVYYKYVEGSKQTQYTSINSEKGVPTEGVHCAFYYLKELHSGAEWDETTKDSI